MFKKAFALIVVGLLFCICLVGCVATNTKNKDSDVAENYYIDDAYKIDYISLKSIGRKDVPFDIYESILCLINNKDELIDAATIKDKRYPNDEVLYELDIIDDFDDDYFIKYALIMFSWYNSTPKSSVSIESVAYKDKNLYLSVKYVYPKNPTMAKVSGWGISIFQIEKKDIFECEGIIENKIVTYE